MGVNSSILDTAAPEAARSAFDIAAVRADFPALEQTVHGKPLVFLDSAASAQKPRIVADTVRDAYLHGYANVHRGVHTLSQQATDAYEGARAIGQRFLGAASPDEVIYVRGATEGINLVAQSFVSPRLEAGDEIVLSAMEHHSNIVPWQLVAERAGARLRVIPMNDRGELDLDAYADLLGSRTKMVALVHVSNALGTINPIAEMVALAREKGIPTVIDGAQAAPHLPIDVEALGCDFYTISGHKVYGPTGIGLLYGRKQHLDAMPPYQGGGEMISSVSFEHTELNVPPHKFEAGTPHIVGAIGLGAALDYVSDLGLEAIGDHEHSLLVHAEKRLADVPGWRPIGTARNKAAVVSFVIEGVHPHDVGTILDLEGVAVRAGHHCAQPAIEHFGVPATARASFGLYNNAADVDRLAVALERVAEVFS